MNRTIELLRLIRTCGEVGGRKKLQKMVYILKEAGFPLQYRYGFHFHGPFSAELKSELDALANEHLVQEREFGSPSGEFRQYSYAPTEQAQTVLRQFGTATEEPEWARFARVLNDRSAQELEAISTVLYLLRHGCPRDQVRARFEQLKPRLADRFESSMQFITDEFEAAAPTKRDE